MGEYVKYANRPTKIGTCENLYYATFFKFRAALKNGALSWDEGSLLPEDYLQPDSGFRFRFPFPDEDELSLPGLMDVPDFERGLSVTIERGELFADGNFPLVRKFTRDPLNPVLFETNPNNTSSMVTIELVQQKLITHEMGLRLALCYRCPFCDEMWRLEELEEAAFIAEEILRLYAETAADEQAKDFWTKVAERITEGYLIPENELL